MLERNSRRFVWAVDALLDPSYVEGVHENSGMYMHMYVCMDVCISNMYVCMYEWVYVCLKCATYR